MGGQEREGGEGAELEEKGSGRELGGCGIKGESWGRGGVYELALGWQRRRRRGESEKYLAEKSKLRLVYNSLDSLRPIGAFVSSFFSSYK